MGGQFSWGHARLSRKTARSANALFHGERGVATAPISNWLKRSSLSLHPLHMLLLFLSCILFPLQSTERSAGHRGWLPQGRGLVQVIRIRA